jgi:signal transduction histidine kinase
LNIARMASAKGSGESEQLNIAALVSEVVDDLHHSWEARGITVAIESRGQMTVHTVRAAITRVFTNLLSNAIKFSPNGGRIEVQLEGKGTELSVRIADQGAGIASADLDRVFEQFYRTESAGTVSGTGLGLPIVRSLVEQLGGTVHLESDGKSGTTAVLRIPVDKVTPAQESQASS